MCGYVHVIVSGLVVSEQVVCTCALNRIISMHSNVSVCMHVHNNHARARTQEWRSMCLCVLHEDIVSARKNLFRYV